LSNLIFFYFINIYTVSVGTAITTFSRGKYYGQAAIYSSQSAVGIYVLGITVDMKMEKIFMLFFTVE